eukprot:CAMPEP_0119412580 /NCGR_PEP_ID=MMETSP1335-20130426/4976_1 /TAXON_ID=259385 /ORGANISM="Chrysoculter rhomboideus, Strain RCC1486" /LENGTH=184 /DNA_ID=CAMNT_0007437333 /DNA_START=263 /DNA_END=813 /DNA_ORIENTATION=+
MACRDGERSACIRDARGSLAIARCSGGGARARSRACVRRLGAHTQRETRVSDGEATPPPRHGSRAAQVGEVVAVRKDVVVAHPVDWVAAPWEPAVEAVVVARVVEVQADASVLVERDDAAGRVRKAHRLQRQMGHCVAARLHRPVLGRAREHVAAERGEVRVAQPRRGERVQRVPHQRALRTRR